MLQYQTVGGRYFEAMRIPIARGRDFDSSDRRDAVRSVIVNEAAAAQYWPGEDPIGKELRQHNGDPKAQLPWSRVVGVVRSIRQNNLRDQPRPLIYFPLNEGDRNPARSLSYVIRGPQALASGEAIRRTVLALDPDMPLTSLESLAAVLERSVVQFSFTMLTLAIAAGIALLLGAIGLYGVLSYAVSLRTREIGVRLALGAQTSAVMRSVVANGAAIVAIGLVIGLAGAALATRLLGGLLYDTAPLDLATFVDHAGGALRRRADCRLPAGASSGGRQPDRGDARRLIEGRQRDAIASCTHAGGSGSPFDGIPLVCDQR